MAEVGVGFDSLEDRNLKSLGEFRVHSIYFGIDRKEAMLGETNRAETMPTGRGQLEILLGRNVGVGREIGVYVQIDDHRDGALRFGESVANLDVIFERDDMRDQEDLRFHHDSISLGRHRTPQHYRVAIDLEMRRLVTLRVECLTKRDLARLG